MDLDVYCDGLRLERDTGLWTGEASSVSYPAEGHADCLAIEDESFWFRHRNRAIAILLERFPIEGPIFDVGGGNGIVSKALQDAGHEAVVVEPGRTGASNARKRGLRHVVHATLAGARCRPNVLPAVGLFDVVEHVEDDVAFLREVARAMTPGGRLYVTVPAHGWLWSEDDSLAGHYRRYSGATLRHALAEAGLSVEWSTALFGWLPLPMLIARTLPSLIGLSRPSHSSPRHHRLPKSSGGRTLEWLLDRELAAIRLGQTRWLGSSQLAVARKPKGRA